MLSKEDGHLKKGIFSEMNPSLTAIAWREMAETYIMEENVNMEEY